MKVNKENELIDDKNRVILGRDFLKDSIDAGLVPVNTRRLIIDICCDEAVKVYWDCYGTKELLSSGLISGLFIKGIAASDEDVDECKPDSDGDGAPDDNTIMSD